jgi:hypothetical protein
MGCIEKEGNDTNEINMAFIGDKESMKIIPANSHIKTTE